MNSHDIDALEMIFADAPEDGTNVEVVLIMKDGRRITICNTECAARVIRINFTVNADSHVEAN